MTTTRHVHFTFDYDYRTEKWNLSRGSVPPQLKAQGVPHALWMHFWDYAQSVVERASVRNIMRRKLKTESNKASLSKQEKQKCQEEISTLHEQTAQDFEAFRKQAEQLFPNARATASADVHNGKFFGLEIELLHSTYTSDIVHLKFDERRGSWNFSREQVPAELSQLKVPHSDWTAIWDYASGVNDRAKERENLNQMHERELILCHKSLAYMNNTLVDTVDKNASSDSNTTASHIRTKMEKLQRAKEANTTNTKKGWQELQRRARQRFEAYGIESTLLRSEEGKCIGLQLKCPEPKSARQHINAGNSSSLKACSVWFPMSSVSPAASPTRASSPTTARVSSIWLTGSNVTAKRDPPPSASSSSSSTNDRAVLSNKLNTEWKENAPPKPEMLRTHDVTKAGHSSNPVMLTYVHEDNMPNNIEITALSSVSSSESDLGYPLDDEIVIPPPPPTDLPSSIGSSSSISSYDRPILKPRKQVRFGAIKEHVYDNPYSKMDRKTLWYTSEDREASRSKTKVLAQRVVESRRNGKIDNIIFMDSDTNAEVCWRGLEHAKRGNLHYRQEIRKSFLNKVLEKQRMVRMSAMTSRRGCLVVDPEAELQYFAARHSKACRERARKLAAQDAKEARAVYKESLRKAHLQPIERNSSSISSGGSVVGKAMSLTTGSQLRSNGSFYHQNDIFQDYCRQMHLSSKARMQPIAVS